MDFYRGVDLDEVTQSDKCKALIKKFLEAYDLVPDMKGYFQERGTQPVVEFIAKLYDLYVTGGVSDVNSHTIRADLYHFVGARLDSGNIDLGNAIESLVTAIKKNFKAEGESKSDEPKSGEHHRRKRKRK